MTAHLEPFGLSDISKPSKLHRHNVPSSLGPGFPQTFNGADMFQTSLIREEVDGGQVTSSNNGTMSPLEAR